MRWLAVNRLSLTMVGGCSLALLLLYPEAPIPGSFEGAGRPLAAYFQATTSLWK